MEFLTITDVQIPELSGSYRAIVRDAYEIEFARGYTFFVIQYFVLDSKGGQTFNFVEEIANVKNNLRTEAFFGLLNSAGIKFENVYELRGLVFDANLTVEIYQGKPHLHFKYKEVVAMPKKEDSKAVNVVEDEDFQGSFWR